ncbi:MAG: N-acetyltransferase [Burkholderiales bacterium]|nr:N-acetyltransferase [Burkholderiales bacterium]
MVVRAEEKGDHAAVHALNVKAFESAAEAKLVDALRERAQPVISLVAEHEQKIIGHIMFSPVSLTGQTNAKIMGLAPMAVAPERQRSGVGSALVQAGLDHCKRLGFGAVVVLGHPEYYPRFGFVPSTRFGIASEYNAPEEAFMVIELRPGYLHGTPGAIRYHAVFAAV